MRPIYLIIFLILINACSSNKTDISNNSNELILNELEYLEMRGLNVMLANDFYPEGHQGGVGIIQNGLRGGCPVGAYSGSMATYTQGRQTSD